MSDGCHVQVKWGGKKYDLDVDLGDSPLTFKAQLFALTGVEPARMKVIFRGKNLADESWNGFPIKDGAVLMMMGSAGKIPEAPKQKTLFLEDLTEAQLARAMEIPTGLKNLGNTCYMNATLQCLKSVPELRRALKLFPGNVPAALNTINGIGTEDVMMARATAITGTVRDLYASMDKTREEEIIPFLMLQTLHVIFPQFNTKDEHGRLEQQDANECWVEVMRMFQQALPGRPLTNVSLAAGGPATKFITDYFGGQMSVTMKCTETEEEPPVEYTEDFLQLGCYLSQEVKYLHSGLKAKLREEITKNSPTLQRDAKYERSSLIKRLPAYLVVQMVRFYYKEKEQVNAKILKDVKFPMMLDVYDLCGEGLKEKLTPAREKFKEEDDRIAEMAGKMDEEKDLKKVKLPTEFADDPGSNNSGYYDLQAVLTHKGRSSNSGHYVAWVKRNEKEWFVCDDDSVRPVSNEEIMKLSGGGDWHCAYVLVYAPRVLEVPEKSQK